MENVEKIDLTVPSLYISKRIDAYLAEKFQGQFSRSEIKSALEKGSILLNAKKVKASVAVSEGDHITGSVSVSRETTLTPESIPIKVVYEDESILIVDKAVGMVVHPGAGNKKGTLVHALLGRGQALSSEGGSFRPGIVHRLDKETSGLLVVAKDNASHRHLQSQFAERSLTKVYTALVKGQVEFQEGHIRESIGRHAKIRHKMAVSTQETAKEAVTEYKVLKRFKRATLLEVKILTGRTHQIRVHFAHLGYPVLGDEVYGTRKEGERLALHASRLAFEHPKTGYRMTFESPLPDDFKAMVEKAEKESA